MVVGDWLGWGVLCDSVVLIAGLRYFYVCTIIYVCTLI